MNETSFELRKFVSPEFVIGVDARFLAGRYARNFKAKNVFLVTKIDIINSGWVKDVINSLDNEGIEYSIYSDVSPNPRDFEIMKGAEIYKERGCDSIIAIGGGSVIDCAKGIGIVATNNLNIIKFEGVDNISVPVPPLICIPTTAGSSADVSQFAIITNTSNNVKIAIISKKIVPDISLLDPITLTSLPPKLTATTGLDALVHSIEAYVSNASSPVTDIHALESIKLINTYLPLAYHNPDNIEYRYKTMLGSLLAGLAFSNASLGAVHAMAHSLGGVSDLPHGMCNAILLEGVIDFNFDICPERYATIAQAMNINCESDNKTKIKSKLLFALRTLRMELDVNQNLNDLGIHKSDVPQLVKNAMNDPCMATNPKRPSSQDLEKIYEQLL